MIERPLGTTKDHLYTPALCLDLDRMEANIRRMVETCRRHQVAWRPHAKCHKSSMIAQWLVEAGAIGVTCATIDEAEGMVEAGVHDVLIANMVAGAKKIGRLTSLAQRADLLVCIDNVMQATAISESLQRSGASLRVLIELEIGMNRVGVLPGADAVRLAQAIHELPGIRLSGVMAYEGHLLTIKDPLEKETAIRAAVGSTVQCAREIEQQGMSCPIVSCGGTGSFPVTVTVPGVTEIQAGGAIFMDAFYREACQITELEHALTVVATVVSRPTAERAVTDAGLKTFDTLIYKPRVVSHAGVTVDRFSAEHGMLTLAEGVDLQIGEKVELIPGYADLTNVLHPAFLGFRGGKLERVIPIRQRA